MKVSKIEVGAAAVPCGLCETRAAIFNLDAEGHRTLFLERHLAEQVVVCGWCATLLRHAGTSAEVGAMLDFLIGPISWLLVQMAMSESPSGGRFLRWEELADLWDPGWRDKDA